MDGQGMRSDSLRETLASWNEAERGIQEVCFFILLPARLDALTTCSGPHVMYIIPVGQNPTGRCESSKYSYENGVLTRLYRLWKRNGRRKFMTYVSNLVCFP